MKALDASSPRTLIHFPAFRRHEFARVQAHDGMMALLVSSRLSCEDLRAVEDPRRFLPQVRPDVRDIDRLNRRVTDAVDLIEGSERQFVYMAIPYLLSVHHAFVCDCIDLLRGQEELADPGPPGLESVHEAFEAQAEQALPADLLGLFDLGRYMRNRILHAGATQGSHLREKWLEQPGEAREGWSNVSGRPLVVGRSSEPLDLGFPELMACLMTVTRLGREVNVAMRSALSREAWATMVVLDYSDLYPNRFAQPDRRLTRCKGYARERYGALALEETELAEAIRTTLLR